MNYSNYRNNMPHYDSMTYNFEPMGINDYRAAQNSRMRIANTMPTMPGMPDDMFNMRPFIPDTEIPFDIDGDMPALPQTPGMPLMPGVPQMPNVMPNMPGMPLMPGMPNMPGMPQMPNMAPQTHNGMTGTAIPGMTGTQLPGMPRMPETAPGDGNIYPSMPEIPNVIAPTCEQLMELMRRMNCPMDGMTNETNGQIPIVSPENGTAVPPANNR